jgi:type II secretory pathway pseudopilin PulG
MQPAIRPVNTTAGFSLIELIVAMGLLTVIMGVTLAGLSDVMKSNDLVVSLASMNNNLRAGTDLMIRDLLQAGSGLPSSHDVSIPNGNNSQRVRIPGPPGTNFELPANWTEFPAVMPMNGAGPVINGVATDVLAVLMGDNAFMDVTLSAVANTQVTVSPGVNLNAGADRVVAGQLMIISKGSFNTLVQVSSVDVANRVIRFVNGDSLRLNQSGAEAGNMTALNAEDPVNSAANTRISRLRLITYYIDATTDPAHPRLVRRVNNGHPTTFDNALLGTAVATDIYDLQFTYDISNGTNNPGGVAMSAADMFNANGACSPANCAPTQVRKVNLRLRARAPNQVSSAARFVENTLESQVSLRAMAFIDRYR